MDQDISKKQCILYSVLLTFLTLLVIFIFSWGTVEPLEWGLKCNKLTKQCNQKEIYKGGRHLIWPTFYFITFPSNLQNIEFSNYRGANAPPLRTRTAEGLSLGLHISFQYQLIKADIPKLYSMSNLEHELTFIRIARDTILQAAGKYEAPQYWEKRYQIGQAMQKELDVELQKAYAKCINLQLLNIELPDTYELSIVDTQVEVQKKKMKIFEQQAELIRQEIQIMKSDTAQKIKTINSTAMAEAYEMRQKAVAVASNITIDAESAAYQAVQNETGLIGDNLNKYIYYLSMMDQKDAKLLIGLDNTLINLNK